MREYGLLYLPEVSRRCITAIICGARHPTRTEDGSTWLEGVLITPLLDEGIVILYVPRFPPSIHLDSADKTPAPEDGAVKISRVLHSCSSSLLVKDGNCLSGEMICLADNWELIAIELGLPPCAFAAKVGAPHTGATSDRFGNHLITAVTSIPVASTLVPDAE